LRVLQEGEITRVGATGPIRVDVRPIAATNRTLTREVSDWRFREDLFYRLAVAVIELPPLRERGDDAALLSERLLDQVNRESAGEPGYEPKEFSVSARNLLRGHPWPGEVLEMLNALTRAAVWTPGPLIDLDDALGAPLPGPAHRPDQCQNQPLAFPEDVRQGINLNRLIAELARDYLARAMAVSGGNKTKAARLFGLGNPTTLRNWLKRYGVEP
jgi:transcriptional regulator with GAF, ATPase, and Fis domain